MFQMEEFFVINIFYFQVNLVLLFTLWRNYFHFLILSTAKKVSYYPIYRRTQSKIFIQYYTVKSLKFLLK